MNTQSPIKPESDQLTYGSYLRVEELISLQQLQSSPPHHDELLFIIIHQTYELWFKQLLHELDAVVGNLRSAADNPDSDEVYEAARLLRRSTEIARVLVEQFTILETMLPTHFLAFRDKLRPASGFQSEQFREIEFLCGMKDEKMLRFHEASPEMQAQLYRRSNRRGGGRAVHAPLLPVAWLCHRSRPGCLRGHTPGYLQVMAGYPQLAGHRCLHPVAGHGGGRQRAHFRTHEGGVEVRTHNNSFG